MACSEFPRFSSHEIISSSGQSVSRYPTFYVRFLPYLIGCIRDPLGAWETMWKFPAAKERLEVRPERCLGSGCGQLGVMGRWLGCGGNPGKRTPGETDTLEGGLAGRGDDNTEHKNK